MSEQVEVGPCECGGYGVVLSEEHDGCHIPLSESSDEAEVRREQIALAREEIQKAIDAEERLQNTDWFGMRSRLLRIKSRLFLVANPEAATKYHDTPPEAPGEQTRCPRCYAEEYGSPPPRDAVGSWVFCSDHTDWPGEDGVGEDTVHPYDVLYAAVWRTAYKYLAHHKDDCAGCRREQEKLFHILDEHSPHWHDWAHHDGEKTRLEKSADRPAPDGREGDGDAS